MKLQMMSSCYINPKILQMAQNIFHDMIIIYFVILRFYISLICNNSVTTQQCHNSKSVIFQEKLLKFLKCYNFL
jgi:hypothetical protein